MYLKEVSVQEIRKVRGTLAPDDLGSGVVEDEVEGIVLPYSGRDCTCQQTTHPDVLPQLVPEGHSHEKQRVWMFGFLTIFGVQLQSGLRQVTLMKPVTLQACKA